MTSRVLSRRRISGPKGVQVKHYQPEPPVGAETVQQLIDGIEAEGANLGMVVASSSFADEAAEAADAYFEDTGIKIELVDRPVTRGLARRAWAQACLNAEILN